MNLYHVVLTSRSSSEPNLLLTVTARSEEEALSLATRERVTHLPTHVVSAQQSSAESESARVTVLGAGSRYAATRGEAEGQRIILEVDCSTCWEDLTSDFKAALEGISTVSGSRLQQAATEALEQASQEIGGHKEDDEYPFSSEDYPYDESRYHIVTTGPDECVFVDFDLREVDDSMTLRDAVASTNPKPRYIGFDVVVESKALVVSVLGPNVPTGKEM